MSEGGCAGRVKVDKKRMDVEMEMDRNVVASRIRLAVGRKPEKGRKERMAGQ
jgi:hypothetical protein